MQTSDIRRLRLQVAGRVQGVGFRPFVFRIAGELGLAGLVGNDSGGVFIEIEGAAAALARFRERFDAELPPLATVTEVIERELPPRGEVGFHIETSSSAGEKTAQVSPDVATCPDCLREIFDPVDRRYRYPFTNCTNCGPRYSIIRAIPYDRPQTTMAAFAMCPECAREYSDPRDRRFHAQPNACPTCGPRLTFTNAAGAPQPGEPLRLCASKLKDGGIVAIKGIGGFHLACRADDDAVVQRLRERKGREAKPLALMVGSMDAARRIAAIDPAAEAAMTHWSHPIVLAPKRADHGLAAGVAPGTDQFGLMLPYTPLHHLLFAEGLGPLLMTSANPSDEPLSADNNEALKRLGGIADAFLLHDRAIARPLDDSVVMVVSGAAKSFSTPLRRARGFVPQPLEVPQEARIPVLATGGEMKSAFCLLSGRLAILSEHLGELSNAAAYRNYLSAIERLQGLVEIRPELIACDLHPEYAAHRWAHAQSLPVLDVQHHHAHIVSCCAENGYAGTVIGLACDGTGYGTDGAIWGCEALVCDAAGFRRAAHLRPFPLPGGDAAAHETWRPALGMLHEAFPGDWRALAAEPFADVDPQAIELTAARLAANPARIVRSTSLGRLFDAVAFLLGLCPRNRYEAEAAIVLEHAAASAREAARLSMPVLGSAEDGPLQIDFAPMLETLIVGSSAGVDTAELALGFHLAVADALRQTVRSIAADTGLTAVALSGGCFANRILLTRLLRCLMEDGFTVLTHRQVPAGDGGLALGQAVIAAATEP